MREYLYPFRQGWEFMRPIVLYPVLVGLIFLNLISVVYADSSEPLISDNFSDTGFHAGSETPGSDNPSLRPAAVMSWSDVTMVSGKIRNFQKEFRYESGFTRE